MASFGPSSRRFVLPAFVGLVAVASMLPADGPVGRLCQRIVSPFHAAASMVVVPVASVVSWVGSTLRFEHRPVDHGGNVGELHRHIDELQNENIRLRGEVRQLRRENRALQSLPRGVDRGTVKPRLATVAGPSDGAGAWNLLIDRGERFGVRAGQAVVWGANLVGRIASTSKLTAVVERVDSPGVRVDAVLTAATPGEDDRTERRLGSAIQLDATGPMRFEAEPPERVLAEVGDLARLWDAAWPAAAQGRVIGRVVAIEPAPEEPLRKRVVVESLLTLPSLRKAIVLVTEGSDNDGSEVGDGG